MRGERKEWTWYSGSKKVGTKTKGKQRNGTPSKRRMLKTRSEKQEKEEDKGISALSIRCDTKTINPLAIVVCRVCNKEPNRQTPICKHERGRFQKKRKAKHRRCEETERKKKGNGVQKPGTLAHKQER